MNTPLIIYTEKITPRIDYIFNFIFRTFGGISFQYIHDLKEFKTMTIPKINFSNHQIVDEINFRVDNILLENGINQAIDYYSLQPIGQCFYWLSRYEEYVANPQQFDQHNRFLGSELDYSQPIVDQICYEIQKQIQTKYPDFKFKKRSFKQINTHDVDFAWKYKYHSPQIILGSLVKKMLKGEFKLLKQQIQVLIGKRNDPYDQYEYYRTLSHQHGVESIFFWLLGNYNEFDKNHSHHNVKQKKLIQKISSWAEIGIHPSYRSNFNTDSLTLEIKRLENILDRPIRKSRQHFIKLNFPHTYQQLLKNGIQEDYTMGFAHTIGFRAGTVTPFQWFDLPNNQQTLLTIYPFVAMDVTLKNYLQFTPKEAIQELHGLKEKTKKVNGTFITLFHQSNVVDEWESWKKVYESLFHD
ncbi:MAG TPA: polysaccharide deacetylase family protein [Faecalibacter sp.]